MVIWAEHSPPYSLTWLSQGTFTETGLLQLSSQHPQYTKLRLLVSPSYLCSIWYEIWDECPSRKDAKKSGLQAVGQTMAPAWLKQCRTAAWSPCSSTCRHHQHIPNLHQVTEVPRNQSDPALPWLLWGLRFWSEDSWWWNSRAEEAYIHRGILRRTACFHCSSCSWDHRLLLTKVAAGYILNGNTTMTQREKK